MRGGWNPGGAEALELRTLLSGMAPFTSGESYLVPYDSFDTSALYQSSVLANDFDMESDPMTAVVDTDVSNGTLTLSSNGHFVYEPDMGFQGSDSFTYKAYDGTGYSSATTVTLNVLPAFTARTNLDDRPSLGVNSGVSLSTSIMTGSVDASIQVAPGVSLVYQSITTDPAPVIAVETEFQMDTMMFTTPSSVAVDTKLDTIQGSTVYHSGTLSNGFELRFAQQVDASTLDTGRYDYEMTVVGNYTGGQTSSRVFTGSTHIVNQTDSEFGAGWWVQGLDRLVIQSGGVLYVTGDGVAAWYEDYSGTFLSPIGPLSFTTLVENMDGTYTLTDKTGNEASFSSTGLLTERVDFNGNTYSYTYTDADSDSVSDELYRITDPYSREITFAYSGGLLSSVTDNAGRVTTIAHDGNDRLSTVTRPDPDDTRPLSAPVTTYGYSGATNLLNSVTDALSNETTVDYDFANRVDEVTYADSSTSSLNAYQLRGLVDTAVEGSSGNPADLFYPDDPLLTSGASFIDPLQHESDFELDRFGFMTSFLNVLGEQTDYERNSYGLVTSETGPDPDGGGGQPAPVTSYEYDSNGNLTKVTFADATYVTWVYNSLNRPTSRTDELGRTTTWTYDSVGNALTMTDPLSNETAYDYNSAGLLKEITLPDPDGAGALAAPVIEYAYDTSGRLTTTTNPDLTTVVYAWDSADRMTSVTDELSRVTSYTYDDLDRVLTVTLPDPDGAGAQTSPVTTFTYDAVGNVLTMVDALSNTTSYDYDDRYRLTEVTLPDPDGAGAQTSPVLQRGYNSAGWLTSETDALGNVTTYGYDYVGRLTSITQPDPDGAGSLSSPVTSFLLDDLGRTTRVTDALGNYTYFEYDSRNRLIERTDPDPDGGGSQTAPVTEWAYDDAGQLESVTDPLGRVTSYDYDDNGRLTTITLPDPDGAGSQTSPVIERAYDNLGRLITLTDALDNVTTLAYDINSRLISQTLPDPDGAGSLTSPVTEWDYDNAGQLISTTDPLNNVTSYEYDNLGRLTKTTLPDPDGAGSQTAAEYTSTYDALGNVLTATDGLGNTYESEYDNLNRLITTTDAELGDTTYTYDANNNLLSLTDPVSNETTWVYDNLNRVTSETNELSDSISWTYDAAGNVLTTTDRNGRVTERSYDNLQRLSQELWKDGITTVNTIDYTYDAASQITEVEDDSSKYAYTYDMLGRVTEIDNTGTSVGPAVVLVSAYNAGNQRTSLAAEVDSSDDFINSYTYDDLGRLIRVDQDEQSGGNSVAEKRVDLAYTAAGQYASITRYADLAATDLVAETTFTYDDALRLTNLSHDKGMNTLADYSWTYDAAGRLTSVTNVDGTDDYTYDDNGQLTDVDSDYQTDESYTYDANGNRTNTGYTTGSNNQLTSDGTYNYTYDDSGNRTKKTSISTGDYVEYEWDHRNRLTTVTFRDSSDVKQKEVSYTYDVFDRRIAKHVDTDGNGTVDSGESYVYDGLSLADIVLVFDDSDALMERLLYGPGVDQPLAAEDGSGDVTWLLADHQGTIRDVVEYDDANDTTTVVNHLQYSSFGTITSQTNSSYEPRHTYTGREWDAEVDLYYYRARWYDAAVGRFISEDPIGFAGRDTNLSRYVRNATVRFVDPTGHFWDDPLASPPGVPESISDRFDQIDLSELFGPMRRPVAEPLTIENLSASDLLTLQLETYFSDPLEELKGTAKIFTRDLAEHPIGSVKHLLNNNGHATALVGITAIAAVGTGVVEEVPLPDLPLFKFDGQAPGFWGIDAQLDIESTIESSYSFEGSTFDFSDDKLITHSVLDITISNLGVHHNWPILVPNTLTFSLTHDSKLPVNNISDAEHGGAAILTIGTSY